MQERKNPVIKYVVLLGTLTEIENVNEKLV